MGECYSGEEKTSAQKRGSDDQCRGIAPVVFALKDGGNGEGGGKRGEPPAKPRDDDFAKVYVHRARELIRHKTRNATAEGIRRDGRPGALGGVASTNGVLGEISNDTAESTKE